MRKLYAVTACLALLCCTGARLLAQTSLTTTSTFLNNNGSGTVTFNLQNTNSSGVIITDIAGVTGTSGSQAVEFWYKPTPISGSPGAISTANGWIQIAAGAITGIANTSSTTTQPFLTGLNFLLPANTTYGFAVFATGQRYYTMSAATTISAGGVNFLSGPNIGYGGGTPPAAPGNTPRGWIGTITFMPALPCTSPPTAGTSTASSTNVCTGGQFQLGLTGNSMGTGQTYQWQSATTTAGPWTNVGPLQNTPTYNTTATATLYYRNEVTCGTSSAYSTPVQVTVPPLFPGGTYTINSAQPTGGTNFQSFGDAVNAISCGIASSITFNVVPGSGPYNEQVTIPAINTNATRTVTFNGNNNILTHAGVSSDYSILELDGADYFRFKNLTVQPTGSYGYGIVITNGADHNIVDSCTVNNGITNTSSLFAGIVVGGTPTCATCSPTVSSDSNIVSNSEVIGGYYATTSVGSSSQLNQYNQFINNEIHDYYVYGMYLLYNNNHQITGNEFHRTNRTSVSTFYGILNTTGNLNGEISKNRIHDPFGGAPTNTGTGYFIYNAASATAGNENVFSNNIIYNMNGNGTHYCIYAQGNYGRYYYNTVSADFQGATSGSTYGYYQTSNYSGVEFKNNIISISRSGSGVKYCAYHSSSGYSVIMDHNDYYSTGSSPFYRAGALASLAAWQTATGKDAASMNVNPSFFSPSSGDLTPTNLAMDNLGVPIPGIATDIYGITRNTATPDAGAVEFNYPCNTPTNLAVNNLSVNGATVSWTLPAVTGGAQYAVTTSATPPASGTLTNATFVNVTGLALSTTYYLHVRNRCGSATYSAWVSLPFTTCTQAVITPLSALIFCSGSNVTLTANPGTSYVWSLNGTPISGATGSSYTTATPGNYTVTVTGPVAGCVVNSLPVQVQVSTPPANITPSGSVMACPGVGINLAAISGVGYTYQWKLNGTNIPGATASTYNATTAGNYTVFVSSGGNCNATTVTPTTVSLHPVTPASIATPQYTAVCPGTSLTLNANTGSNLAYQWQLNGTDIPGATAPSRTLSTAGVYRVEVTSVTTGCSSFSAPITISSAVAPVAAISSPGQLTACDSAVLSANSGAGFTYQWIRNGSDVTGATAQTYGAPLSGTYTVRVTNNAGCHTTSAPVAVTVNPSPSGVITYNSPLIFCAGSAVVLDALEENGMLYQWMKNGSPIPGASDASYIASESGVYALHLTNSYGCSKMTDIVTVTVHPLPDPLITRNGAVLSTGSYMTYQWFFNNQPIPGATGQSLTMTQNGAYSVTVTDANGCTGGSAITFVNSLGVGSLTAGAAIKIYPNPATDIVHVEAPVPVDLTLRDIRGRIVLEQKAATTLNLQQLTDGVYFLFVADKQGQVIKAEKLVKGR